LSVLTDPAVGIVVSCAAAHGGGQVINVLAATVMAPVSLTPKRLANARSAEAVDGSMNPAAIAAKVAKRTTRGLISNICRPMDRKFEVSAG
jgi:hypothetical protein